MQRYANKIIAVDFDGTCVTHEYPAMGKAIGAAPVLRKLVAEGAKIILWTMRSGNELREAKEWFGRNSIPLFGVNENPQQKSWTTSPKAYANKYIDDNAVGVPLITPKEGRPYVDWVAIEKIMLPRVRAKSKPKKADD